MKKYLGCMMALLFAAVGFGADKYSGGRISLDKPDGIYKVGETATCSFTLLKNGKPCEGVKARMILRWEGKMIDHKEFVTTGKPMTFSYKADKPGWVYFGFQVLNKYNSAMGGENVMKHPMKRTITGEIGAMFEPENIRTGVKRPEDFEAFWAERRAKLDKVPLKPKYTELDSPVPGVKLFTVEIPAIGEYPVTGYFAIPENAKPKSLPAYIDWASWSATDADRNSAIKRAKNGGIGFAPTWHGRPSNMGKDYYDYKTTIKIDGGLVGIEDREKWCFSDMYYRVMRALDFMKSRPEWDGRNLISIGGSLGGAQSAAAAALDKDVTLAVISVPCFCEFDGAASGHKSSIPHIRDKRIAKGDRRPLEAGAYFDCVNFAPMIKCETYVCTGFTDELCPPSNVYSFYNALPATTKKVMTTNPRTGHYGTTRNVQGDERLQKLMNSVKVSKYDVK